MPARLQRTSARVPKAITLLLSIKFVGTLFATLVFSRFSPLVDANLYLQGFYENDDALRTRMVQYLASALNHLGGATFAHWIFGLVSLAGLLHYYVVGGKRWVLMLTLLFPSSLIWTSIVGKEALFFGCFTLLLALWARFSTNALSNTDVALALVSFLVCALLRPHYAIVVVWLFCSAGAVRRQGWKAWPILAAIFVVSAIGMYFSIWESLVHRGFGGIDHTARASRFELFDIEPKTNEGVDRFKAWLPLGVITGIIGPLPHELLSRLEFVPFFAEGLFILLFPCAAYFYAKKQTFVRKEQFRQIFLLCLAPAIFALMILHAPFGILNPGSATRWRVNFEAIFYLAPLLLLFHFQDDPRHEDSALSS